MERILFIIPPYLRFDDFVNPSYNVTTMSKKDGKSYGNVPTDMPLGALSISAYLKKHVDVEVRLIDFNVILNKLETFEYESYAGLYSDIFSKTEWSDFNPTIVCISTLFTSSYWNMLDVGKSAREIFDDALIIAGGGVPTNMYKDIYKDKKGDVLDALCYGEGEKPMLRLVTVPDKRDYLTESYQWITKKKMEDGVGFKHDFIDNLDEIPFYDYDICNPESYCENPAIRAYASVEEKSQNFHVMTSRGCTFKCSFCSSYTVHGRTLRYCSVERVREDFKRLRDEYGAKTVIFQDDHLMGDKERALEIIGIVKELGLNAVFQNSLAMYALDRTVLEALKDAGVNQLPLAVESGSARVLKEIMHKPLNLSIVKRVADDCRDLGIYTNVNILLGMPGETKKDIEDARSFLKTVNANWFIILCATPLPGTEMLDICVEKGYLTDSYIDSGFKKPIVKTEDFTPQYIDDIAYKINLELNFVENSDVRHGDYEVALKGFENAIRAKNDHAFAYYYASKCYEKLGDSAKAKTYVDTAKKIITENSIWSKYADIFGINIAGA